MNKASGFSVIGIKLCLRRDLIRQRCGCVGYGIRKKPSTIGSKRDQNLPLYPNYVIDLATSTLTLTTHLLFQKPKVDKTSQIINQIVINGFVIFVIWSEA
jgi:hypothetical protein